MTTRYDEIKRQLDRVRANMDFEYFSIDDIACIEVMARGLIDKCCLLYDTRIYDTVMRLVPDEIWLAIFNLTNETEYVHFWINAKTVSKQWCNVIGRLEKLRFGPTECTVESANRMVTQFHRLRTVKLPYKQTIDFALLTTLKKLSFQYNFKHPQQRDTAHFRSLSLLTNLTHLSIGECGVAGHTILTSFPTLMKQSITYMNIRGNRTIIADTLKQFTNLTCLKIGSSQLVGRLSHLPSLSTIKCRLIVLGELKSYNGYAEVTSTNVLYKGNVSNGKFNGEGTSYYAGGDTYHGFYLDGDKHGAGIYTFESGRVINGQWAYGRPRDLLR